MMATAWYTAWRHRTRLKRFWDSCMQRGDMYRGWESELPALHHAVRKDGLAHIAVRNVHEWLAVVVSFAVPPQRGVQRLRVWRKQASRPRAAVIEWLQRDPPSRKGSSVAVGIPWYTVNACHFCRWYAANPLCIHPRLVH